MVQTLWGELAWQLGGAASFALVAHADRTRTNPGDALRLVLRQAGACLILIDEWVAYARVLYGDDSLPAGTFDTHFTFAQMLTDGAGRWPGPPRRVDPGVRLGDSVVGSDLEVGGPGGREALRRPRSVIGRVESSWRPATAEESFEIVCRRLFQPVDTAHLADRDATARVFGDLYRTQASEFPVECREQGLRRQDQGRLPDPPRTVRPALRGLVDAGAVPAHPGRAAPDGDCHRRPVGRSGPVADDSAGERSAFGPGGRRRADPQPGGQLEADHRR